MQTRSMTLKNNEKKAVANMCANIMMDLKKRKTLTINHHKRGKGEYEGGLNNNKPHGYGKCIWNGEETMGGTYVGEWEAGEMCGKGKMTYKNGNVYEGRWEKGKCTEGKITLWNKDIYEGEFKNGLMYGNGKMTYENGEVYDGQWINNCYNGKGKMTYENGDIYEGEWQWKTKHGTGKMIYNTGEIYEGSWSQDVISGYGKMTFSPGYTYQGWWFNGKIDSLYTIKTLKKYM